MKHSAKVDHKCTVPATDRQWDSLGGTEHTVQGNPLNEIWKCRACGYEFELKRLIKKPKRIPHWQH